MSRRLLFLVLGLVGFVAGCGSSSLGAHFDGHARPSLVSAQQVRDISALPTGYVRLGEVRAHCTRYEGKLPPDGAKLSDVDCGGELLTRAIRERAAEVGGELLVARRCRSRVERESDDFAVYSVTCSAAVARPDDSTLASRPLRPRTQVADAAPSAREGWRIVVRFAENSRAARRPPRRVDYVRQVPTVPVSHQQLGAITTECSAGCSRAGAENAVLVAAGRFGASDVAELSCARRGKGFICQGKAAAYEVDPEQHAEAR